MAEASARDQAKQRMLRLERMIGPLGPHTQLIDVGCGLNYLLSTIKAERGAVGTGIDMKEQMVARIRDRLGMPAIQGTLHEARLPAAKLDVVTMIEYLEHEPDPPGTLAEARRVLKTGGHVAIEIPHYAGWPARVFKSRWANLDVPRHLVFFEPDTLRSALAKHGFEMLSYQPFTMRFHFGINLLLALGARGIGRNPLAPLLATWLSLPFLPFQRWLPEFALAVARAV
jgi:ubiquinone/menaquinone biosynthesis C-methylase UbiE